ncbi:hypothetical protein CCAND95_40041 [Capnocytophaga canis]|uniref:Uncharacterized protein n=1 Tax=Capnocytophaga canis TaxID=1848903 RepID=A0A0B7HWI5_9FLAO|nr:hypothetical protein CCAND38_150039 [Capnocytophaga canis]CEN44409.1 hypothetical protein CCAND95_40041 [Capnocytophaga canis]
MIFNSFYSFKTTILDAHRDMIILCDQFKVNVSILVRKDEENGREKV